MTDRELLELAAKAAGISVGWSSLAQTMFRDDKGFDDYVWNPLTDDSDALQLAVICCLSMDLFDNEVIVGYTPNSNDCSQVVEATGLDPYTAARRAIVRAAAEIGKEMLP